MLAGRRAVVGWGHLPVRMARQHAVVYYTPRQRSQEQSEEGDVHTEGRGRKEDGGFSSVGREGRPRRQAGGDGASPNAGDQLEDAKRGDRERLGHRPQRDRYGERAHGGARSQQGEGGYRHEETGRRDESKGASWPRARQVHGPSRVWQRSEPREGRDTDRARGEEGSFRRHWQDASSNRNGARASEAVWRAKDNDRASKRDIYSPRQDYSQRDKQHDYDTRQRQAEGRRTGEKWSSKKEGPESQAERAVYRKGRWEGGDSAGKRPSDVRLEREATGSKHIERLTRQYEAQSKSGSRTGYRGKASQRATEPAGKFKKGACEDEGYLKQIKRDAKQEMKMAKKERKKEKRDRKSEAKKEKAQSREAKARLVPESIFIQETQDAVPLEEMQAVLPSWLIGRLKHPFGVHCASLLHREILHNVAGKAGRHHCLIKSEPGTGKSLFCLVAILAQLDKDALHTRPVAAASELAMVQPTHCVVVPTLALLAQYQTWTEKLLSTGPMKTALAVRYYGEDAIEAAPTVPLSAAALVIGVPRALCAAVEAKALTLAGLRCLFMDECDALIQSLGAFATKQERIQHALSPPPAVALLKHLYSKSKEETERATHAPRAPGVQVIAASATLNRHNRRELRDLGLFNDDGSGRKLLCIAQKSAPDAPRSAAVSELPRDAATGDGQKAIKRAETVSHYYVITDEAMNERSSRSKDTDLLYDLSYEDRAALVHALWTADCQGKSEEGRPGAPDAEGTANKTGTGAGDGEGAATANGTNGLPCLSTTNARLLDCTLCFLPSGLSKHQLLDAIQSVHGASIGAAAPGPSAAVVDDARIGYLSEWPSCLAAIESDPEACHRSKRQLLVGSDLDARGLDLKGNGVKVSKVILFGRPLSVQHYIHMAGRVGRYTSAALSPCKGLPPDGQATDGSSGGHADRPSPPSLVITILQAGDAHSFGQELERDADIRWSPLPALFLRS